MGRKLIKIWLKKYRRPLTCLRFLLIYWIFLLIAKHSSVFNTGMVPEDKWTVLVVSIVVIFRFLCIAFVPGILVLWIFELFSRKRTVERVQGT